MGYVWPDDPEKLMQKAHPMLQQGRGRIENIAIITFVTALMGYFVYTILDIIESAESISVETRVKQLRSAANWKFSELVVTGKQHLVADQQGANPFEWIEFGAFDNDTLSDKRFTNDTGDQDKPEGKKRLGLEPDLATTPLFDNYLGSFDQFVWSSIPSKKWLYDRKNKLIIYKLAYPQAIEHNGPIKDQLQWQLKVEIIFEPDPFTSGSRQRAEGLILEAVYPYHWKN